LPPGKLPTGTVSSGPWTRLSSWAESKVSPHGYVIPPGPRAAFSISAAVGRRRAAPTTSPRHAQYAAAWYQVTSTTGCCSRPGGGRPSCQTNRATSVAHF